MSKLNQLQVSVVLKVKQIQNLIKDETAFEKWQMIKEQEDNTKLENLQNRIIQDEDPIQKQIDIDQQKAQIYSELDWRGYFLPETLKKTVLFTRQQLLQLINR